MARVSFEDVKRIGIALAWVVLFWVLGLALTFVGAKSLPAWGGPAWDVARTGVYEVVAFGVLTLLIGRVFNKLSWPEMGWRRPTITALLRGVTVGALMAAFAIGLAIVLGARLHFTGDWRLTAGIGVFPAMIVVGLPFALLHAANPSVTVFSLANIFLAAIWLSVAFFSGGMPLAWGAHFGWNAGLAILFDAPVSGYAFHVPVVEYAPGAHAWLDGGAFGPEGGIVATIALLTGTLYLLTRKAAFAQVPA